MQDRAKLNNGKESDIEEFDPLTINKCDEAVKKINALFACDPLKVYYAASQRYDFYLDKKCYSIRLTKPLINQVIVRLDLTQSQSRLTEKNVYFQKFLEHFKQNSFYRNIYLFQKTHLIAFEDESNTVNIWHVVLHNSLVLYPRKKDSNDMRFAVLDEKLSSGGFGQIYISRRSISSSSEKNVLVKIKQKSPDKYRIAKIQTDEYVQSFEAYLARHEYEMTSTLAPDLAAKQRVKNWSDQKSAILMHYIPGDNLWRIICSNVIKSDLERFEFCLAVANALHDVHARGGVHGDVKPPNVICRKDQDGQVRAKFVDYGCSILQSGKGRCITATVGYFAPELCEGKAITVASDIYALGQSFKNVFGYPPSAIGNHDKSNCEILRTLGWNALLDEMCKASPQERASLDNVIERLKSIIAALKAKPANQSQSRSIFSPAAAAAPAVSEVNQESEACAHHLSSVSP